MHRSLHTRAPREPSGRIANFCSILQDRANPSTERVRGTVEGVELQLCWGSNNGRVLHHKRWQPYHHADPPFPTRSHSGSSVALCKSNQDRALDRGAKTRRSISLRLVATRATRYRNTKFSDNRTHRLK